MNSIRKVFRLLPVMLGLMLLASITTHAQLNATTTVNVTYEVPESIAIQASPSSVDLSAQTPITVQAQWNLNASRSSQMIELGVYFTSGAALTDAAGDSINASEITCNWSGFGAVNGVFGPGPDGMDCGGGYVASMELGESWARNYNLTGTLILNFNFGVTNAGSYSGTLNLIVEVV